MQSLVARKRTVGNAAVDDGHSRSTAFHKPEKIRPELGFRHHHHFRTQRRQIRTNRRSQSPAESRKRSSAPKRCAASFCPVSVVVETTTRWPGNSRSQRIHHRARSHNLSHRDRVNPDRGLCLLRRQFGRNISQSLAQSGSILAVPQHLQQPVRQRHQEEEAEQRTVDAIHFEKSHSKRTEHRLESLAASYNSAMRRSPCIPGRPNHLRSRRFRCTLLPVGDGGKRLCHAHGASALAPIPRTTIIPRRNSRSRSIPTIWPTRPRSSAPTTTTMDTCRSFLSSPTTATNRSRSAE